MIGEDALRILELLITGNYITASCLAEELGCSSKTVRTRVRELNDEFQNFSQYKISIESKPRFGFRLSSEKEVTMDELGQILGLDQEKNIPVTLGERSDYLLFFLLEHKEYVTILELSERLFVSESVIKTTLKSVEEILKWYDIQIERRPGYGIRAVGDETNIRTCLVEQLSEHKNQFSIFHKTLEQEMEIMSGIVQKLMKEQKISIPEIPFYNFVKYICISIRRIRKGKEVCFENQYQTKVDSSNKLFVKRLSEEIKKGYHIELSENEEEYMAIQLAGKRVIGNSGEGNLIYREELNSLVTQMIDIILKEFNIDLSGNFDLIMQLNQHMVPLDIRLRYNIPIENPVLEEIKANYPFAYTIARRTAVVLGEHYDKEVSESEIGYLAVIWELGLEKQKTAVEPSNILIVCSSGKGSSRLLTFRYRQEFGEYINQIKICNLFELKSVDFDDIDYVFTTVPITEPVPVPVYEVNLFLNNEDIAQVRQILEKGASGILHNYFKKELFFTELLGNKKEDIIRELCERSRDIMDLPSEFEESVLHREELSSTDYGNLIAIPHPYKATGKETRVIVGLLKEPVFWGRNMVQVVFLIAIGELEDQNLQRFYQQLMKILMNQDLIEEFIKSKDLNSLLNHK